MKRDMDLVRAILLTAENHEEEYVSSAELHRGLSEQFPDSQWSTGVIPAHVRILNEAGLVEAELISEAGSSEDTILFLRLTWEGHEFIADARDPRVWEKVKSKGGDVSFTLIKQILAEVVKMMLSQ